MRDVLAMIRDAIGAAIIITAAAILCIASSPAHAADGGEHSTTLWLIIPALALAAFGCVGLYDASRRRRVTRITAPVDLDDHEAAMRE